MSNRRCLQSRHSRFALAILIFIAILAVVIPPAVVVTLHKKNDMGPKAKVFVPLYVYPAPGAWTPLEDVYVVYVHSTFQPLCLCPFESPHQPEAFGCHHGL